MKFKPMFDKVVIRPADVEETTESGILLPPSAQETPSKGEVVAVGPGTRDETGNITPLLVEVGDHVVYGKYAGSDIEIDGEKLVLLEEESIMGILD